MAENTINNVINKIQENNKRMFEIRKALEKLEIDEQSVSLLSDSESYDELINSREELEREYEMVLENERKLNQEYYLANTTEQLLFK